MLADTLVTVRLDDLHDALCVLVLAVVMLIALALYSTFAETRP